MILMASALIALAPGYVWKAVAWRETMNRSPLRLVCAVLFCLAVVVAVDAQDEVTPPRKPSIFPEARDHFSGQVAKEIQKHKACSGVEITAIKDKADYVAHTGWVTSSWALYRRDGKVVATGGTMRMSTLIREVCEAVKKDYYHPRETAKP